MKLNSFASFLLAATLCSVPAPAQDKDAKKPDAGAKKGAGHEWLVFEGQDGPGKGKHIVLMAGDEEYRSEEAMPMLARLLSTHHGFKCTVLFSLDPANGNVDPNNHDNIPGMENLATADLMIFLWRFRDLPDSKMKHFADYYLAGKPIIALRTSTHAFSIDKNKGAYAKYDWRSKEWPGGFGKQVLGETWVSHWGGHKSEATKGLIEPAAKDDPILKDVTDIFGDTDVYEAHPPADAKILVKGQVLAGMTPDSPPVKGRKNDEMQPVAWTREYKNEAGKTNKILTTTMGSSTDLQNAGLRRLLVNAAFAFTGLPVPAAAKVDFVGEFKPTAYGFNGFKKGLKPVDFAK